VLGKGKHEKERVIQQEKRKILQKKWWLAAIENIRNNGVESKIIEREKAIQRQKEENRIRKAKYDKKYKKIGAKTDSPNYLRSENLDGIGDGIKTLIRTRCENMEQDNKSWVKENRRICVFCPANENELK